ncbi:hypothetical protein [Streptomyces sp. DSM 118878]
MTTAPAPSRVIPYITAREGEEADILANLRALPGPRGREQLCYVDESPADRDQQGVLYARYSMSMGTFGQPVGEPRWKLVHPVRQRVMMGLLRCQVCTTTLPRKDGMLFMIPSPHPLSGPLRTAHPPLCLPHARLSAVRCKRLRVRGYVALRATRYPLYGVMGTPYSVGAHGLQALAGDDEPLPYSHPQIGMFLASQLVRELRDYQVVDLDDLAVAA